MSQPYLGQISTFGFGFPPRGYAVCNGQLLPINQNQALFALLGTTYGGNGVNTFALPNLQGSVPLMAGVNYVLGQVGGEVNHTLAVGEMSSHTHPLLGATSTPSQVAAATPTTTLGNGSSAVGSGQAHPNQQPYLVVNFCIALAGIFPSRS
jgi:microcystin-dependent protein